MSISRTTILISKGGRVIRSKERRKKQWSSEYLFIKTHQALNSSVERTREIKRKTGRRKNRRI